MMAEHAPSVEERNDDGLPRPYQNAQHYRSHLAPNAFLNVDVIDIAPDGTAFAARSELTGRIWNGIVQVADSVDRLVQDMSRNTHPDIVLSNGVSDGRFFPDSLKLVVVDDGGQISIHTKSVPWNNVAQSGERREAWMVGCSATEHDEGILTVDVTQQGEKIITGGADCCIKIWDLTLTSIHTVRPAHTHHITDVTANPVSQDLFITTGLDGFTALWDIRSLDGKAKMLDSKPYGGRCLCWLSEDQYLVGYENGDVVSKDVRQGNSPLHTFNIGHPVHRLVFNERLLRVAICGDSPKVSVYSVNENELQNIYEDSRHTKFARDLCWSNSDDKSFHSCGWDGKIIKHSLMI